MLLSMVFLLSSCLTAYAGEIKLSTVIPEYHTVTVETNGGKVLADGKVCGGSLQVKRHDEQAYWILPDSGKMLDTLYYNGEDVTSQVKNGVFIAQKVSDDARLRAVFKDAPAIDSDKTYDITGTLTDENGKPVSDAVVDIGGKTGRTDEDGNFTVPDVPTGTHTVVITDKDGNVIGHTQITIDKQGDSGLALTTDDNGNYVIRPNSGTKTIALGLSIGENGVITVNSARDAEEAEVPDTDAKETDTPDTDTDAPDVDKTKGNSSKISPKTGDETNPQIWMILLAASAVIMFESVLKKREQNTNE